MGHKLYSRQKMLLALLEAAGGQLNKTDCQKLLFLLCQKTKNHYDFFPYQYGGFSHVLYADKTYLTRVGLLEDLPSFKTSKSAKRYIANIGQHDMAAASSLISQETTRGRKLIKRVYIEYPYYAHRSKIAARLLNQEELTPVLKATPEQKESVLFTVGYEGISIDAYLGKLITNNVKALVDVRKNPLSRKFGFSQRQLSKFLHAVDILYFHFPNLGVPSNMRRDLGTPESYKTLFTFYQQTLEGQRADLHNVKSVLHEHKRIALTCFEANHLHCHRNCITEYFEQLPNHSFEVKHI